MLYRLVVMDCGVIVVMSPSRMFIIISHLYIMIMLYKGTRNAFSYLKLHRSEKESPEVIQMKTYLAGNLDSVALEMNYRYRGRNRYIIAVS